MTLAEKLLQDMNRGILYHFDEDKFLNTVAEMFAEQKDVSRPYVDMSYEDYRAKEYNKEVSENGFEVRFTQSNCGPISRINIHSQLLDAAVDVLRTNGFNVRDYCNAKKKCIRLF